MKGAAFNLDLTVPYVVYLFEIFPATVGLNQYNWHFLKP